MGHHCPWPRCCHKIRRFLWGFVQAEVRGIDLSFCKIPAAVTKAVTPASVRILPHQRVAHHAPAKGCFSALGGR